MPHSLQERCTYGNEKTLITIRISSFQHSFSKTTQGLFLIKKCRNENQDFAIYVWHPAVLLIKSVVKMVRIKKPDNVKKVQSSAFIFSILVSQPETRVFA